VLAAQFGVRAFEMVLEGRFGEMVAYRHPNIISVPFTDAISNYNFVNEDSYLIQTARGVQICLGDR
jgi:6-phosphofructokinase 1